jgi:hypothetical protein
MAQRGKYYLMVLDQNCMMDAAEFPISASAARPLSGLKCEVMLYHVEASLQWLSTLISFIWCLHTIFQEFCNNC